MKVYVVVPARLASTRLPGKPLLELDGIPMIVRVLQRAHLAEVDGVIAAVDDDSVLQAVQQAGYAAVMTGQHHISGSDRVMEVAQLEGWSDDDVVINVQGDEPLVPPSVIDQLARHMRDQAEVSMASLYELIEHTEDFFDPNVVKVVRDAHGNALYFSRAPVPYPRDMLINAGPEQPVEGLDLSAIGAARHIGIYGFRVGALSQFVALADARLEHVERLEQLRWLEAGRQISMLAAVEPVPGGVDTREDLQRVEGILLGKTTRSGSS